MHGFFFPGAFFWPALLFGGLFKILLFVLLISLVVRLVGHGHWRSAYAHPHGPGYGHSHAYDYGSDPDPHNLDPRRVAAWRYAAGKIDRVEFDRIMSGLDASAPAAPSSPPAPPVA